MVLPEDDTTAADSSADANALPSRSKARRHNTATSAIAFVFFFLVMAVWSIGTPIWGSPDEPAHALRAYSVVHGQIYVAPIPGQSGPGGLVKAPKGFYESQAGALCYEFKGDVPANCAQDPSGDESIVKVLSTAARYNPLYYAIVGLPSYVIGPRHLLFAMRLVSAALSAWMLAWALTSAGLSRRPRITQAAVLLAATPMVLFVGAMVNPNGLEITAACALWVNLLVLVRGDDPLIRPLLIRRAGIAATLMVLTRSLSPLWLALILGCVAVAAMPGLRARLRGPDFRRWSIVVASATVLAVIWIRVSGSITQMQLQTPLDLGLRERIHEARLAQIDNFDQEVGVFGWLDTRMWHWAYQSWATLGIICAALGLIFGRWRDRLAMVVVAALTYAVPIAANAYQWNKTGNVWQGRYSLPMAVGVVFITAFALADSRWMPNFMSWIIAVPVVAAAGSITVWAFMFSLYRYSVGSFTHPFSIHGLWAPPGGATHLTAFLAFVLLLGCVAVLAVGPRLAPLGVRRAGQPTVKSAA